MYLLGLASSGPESRLAEGEYLSRVATPHTVHIVKLPLPNAMVLPNGTIFIFTGLLNLNLSDAELAGVLAHELSHQLLEHSMERLSFTQFISVVTFLLQGVIGFEDTLSRYVLKVFSSLILELPHSRRTEREADTVGLQVLAGACFEPRAVISFWQKMDQFERMKETLANDPDAVGDLSGTTPASSHHASFMTLLSTHPGHGERKNYLLREMDKAQSIYDTRCSPSATVGRWF